MEQVTESIARFVCTTTYRAVPPEAVEAARMHILDTLGVLIAGSQEGVAPIVKNHVSAAGGPPESTLMTQGVRTSAQYAAFGNGIIGHVLDYDDYEWPSFAHPSVTVLPAAIALAEKLRRGGQECLTAYLLGMDVIAKIGKGMSPDHYDKGWHSTGTLGSLGAACACASLLGLDSEKTKIALGIAASMSSGLRGNFGTMTKSLHAGHAARNGVEAALLAWAGFTASARILEGDLGFCDLFSDTGKYRPEEMTKDLGNPFSLVFPRVGKKLYPSCAATHAFLDGMFRLIEEHDIKPEEVRSVECGIYYLHPKMLIHARPATGLEGKFSLEFCLALALKERAVRLSDFSDEKVRDPVIQTLIGKVTKAVTDEAGGKEEEYPKAIIRVNLQDGKSCSYKGGTRRGGAATPLTESETVTKFLDCAQLLYSRQRADEILETVMNVERLQDVSLLTAIMA